MALSEIVTIDRLAGRIQNASEQMIFAGVVALTRTAKHAQRAVQDNLSDVFIIRNKWTIQGIRITPATKQKQEAEVYSKDWYMPVHEAGGTRSSPKGFFIPVGIRDALGISRKELIPRWAAPKNLMKGKRRIGNNRPFFRTMPSGQAGLFVRTTDKSLPIKLLYAYQTNPIRIPQRKWFWHEVEAAYDKYLESEYNNALLEAWSSAK